MTPVNVCLLPRSVFADKDALVRNILSASPSSLSADHILDASTAALYPLLTLVLCAIDEEPVASVRFLSLARALRDRCATHRVLKHRLLTGVNHASFPCWHLRAILRRSAYATARARLRGSLHDPQTSPQTPPSEQAQPQAQDQDPQYNTSRAFCEYVAQIIFAPSRVSQWASASDGHDHTFSTYRLTEAVRNTPGITDHEHARRVAAKLVEYGLATPSNKDNNMEKEKHASEPPITYLEPHDPDQLHFPKLRSSFTHAIHDAEALHLHTHTGRLLSGGASQLVDGEQPQSVVLVMPVDMIDLQSLDFWTEHIYEKNAEKGVHYGIRSVVHPLLVGSIERDGDTTCDDEKPYSQLPDDSAIQSLDDVLIDRVVVTKVFSSLSRPCMAELRRLTEGSSVDDTDLHQTVYPSLLIKKGDNLMQDHCVSVMFQVFNYVWRHSATYRDATAVPHCLSYEVVPTSVTMGYIEGVANVTALGEVDWQDWYGRHARDASGAVVENLLHSAAGAFVGGYVMGATDRHWGNMVVKDDRTLLHIDFSFILGDAPPIDAPRISVPPAMEKVFRGIKGDDGRTTLWDTFVEATVSAFLALRKDAPVVLRAAEMLFSHAGFERDHVHKFLTSKSGLALEKSEADAADYLRRKVKASSGHWKTHFKRFVHDIVNPAWYAMVQKGPVPADGVMKMINRYQAESASTQKLISQQDQKNEQTTSSYKIDDPSSTSRSFPLPPTPQHYDAPVKWSVRCDATQWGESVAVLGSFNAWNKRKLVALTTDARAYPTWTATHEVAAGDIEYKYVIAKDGAICRWETDSGDNRRLVVKDGVSTSDVFGQIPSRNHSHAQNGHTAISQHDSTLENKFLTNNNHHAHDQHHTQANLAHLDPVQRALVDMTRDRLSWRLRLQFVRSLFTDRALRDDARSLPGLVSVAVYMSLLSTGQVRCGEDGGHHRPNHHAHEARLIDAALSSLVHAPDSSGYTAHVVRRILPHLPSYSSQFTVSVPLTRIRDIAHRGDIPKDLKLQIKHTLQNKLHRNAGPEDLYTSAAILDRISHGGYSQPFVDQFRIFHDELRAFFNMSSLDDRLRYLSATHHVTAARTLLDLKTSGHASPFDQLQTLVTVRAAIANLPFMRDANRIAAAHTSSENNNQSDILPGEDVQKTRLADIDLEAYAFVLVAALAKEVEQPHHHESTASFPFAYAASVLALAVRVVAQSFIEPRECDAIANELSACSSHATTGTSAATTAAVAGKKPKGDSDLLRLRAAVERATRFAAAFSDAIVKVYAKQAGPLARALGVEDRAVAVLPEAEVRSTVTFQASRVAAALAVAVRKRLGLPPWDALHAGVVSADRVVHVTRLGDVPPSDSDDSPVVVVCASADGDEDIPRGVVGVVNGRPLPHLSHLGVRARQAGVVFVSADDSAAFGDVWNHRLSGSVKLEVTVEEGLKQLINVTNNKTHPSTQKKTNVPSKPSKPTVLPETRFVFDANFTAVVDIQDATRARVSAKAATAGALVRVARASGGLFDAVPGVAVPHGAFHAQRTRHAKAYGARVSAFHSAATGAGDSSGCGSKAEVDAAAHAVWQFIYDEFTPGPATLEAIRAAFPHPDQQRVMVRSSANAEDLETLSGAGLYDTIANVPVADGTRLDAAIRTVWASTWTARAASSRRAFGVNDAFVSMAVLIQPMARAALSFVAFSREPVAHGDDIYVEMAVGMGETLASAAADGNPYRFRVDRETWAVEDVALASYSHALVPKSDSDREDDQGKDEGGLVKQIVDYSRQRLTTDRQWRHSVVQRIAKCVGHLEDAFDGPQDVEGCVTLGNKDENDENAGAGKIVIVQARPQIVNA